MQKNTWGGGESWNFWGIMEIVSGTDRFIQVDAVKLLGHCE